MTSSNVCQTNFPDDESSMVKVGVVGCGRIGMLHLEALTKAPGVLPIICSNPHVRHCHSYNLFTCIRVFPFNINSDSISLFSPFIDLGFIDWSCPQCRREIFNPSLLCRRRRCHHSSGRTSRVDLFPQPIPFRSNHCMRQSRQTCVLWKTNCDGFTTNHSRHRCVWCCWR